MMTWLGSKLSGFEMTRLLVGVLGYEVVLDESKPNETVMATLVQGVYLFFALGNVYHIILNKSRCRYMFYHSGSTESFYKYKK